MAIIRYNTDHTRPMNAPEGVHVGLCRWVYHVPTDVEVT